MRALLPALLLPALLLAAAASPAAAGPADAAAFERSVAATKQAMIGDPARALASAKGALELARRLPDARAGQVAIATARWLEGEASIFLNDAAAAAPAIDEALAIAERVSRDTKLHGDALRSRGTIAAMTGRPLEALRDYQRAHDVFQRAGEARSRAITLQDIGMIYYDAGDYSRVLDYTVQAEEAYPRDPMLTLTLRNNRAEVYRKQKRFALAVVEYRAALVQARKLKGKLLQARIYTNLATSEAEAGRLGPAQAAVDQAAKLAADGEGAGWRPFVFGSAAEIAEKRGDFDGAARLLARTFEGLDIDKSDMQFREIHQVASRVYEARGDSALALRHLKAFQRLDSEAQQLTASNASQLMAARFDFANQDLKISKLRQDQLRRDVDAERDRSRLRNILFGGLTLAGAIALGVLLFGFLAVRRSRDAVAAANDSLHGVNSALEKALKAKTEFLATTSHEIRTPLNGILGMTQVLLADRTVEASLRERIEVVHGAGETMKALVDDILDVAKMESGELTVASEPCDFASILDDAARLWSGQAQAKGLELVLDMADAPRRIVSDGPRVRQIVFNLMSNALKFTAEGGVTLRASAEPGPDGSESLVIRVTDTGIGIPAESLSDIFEAFKQVDGGVTRQFGGTGLGLAICKRLAVALGGDITVASVPGQGTTFTVSTPLRRVEEAPEQPGGVVATDTALEEARVCLLDANPLNQGVMRVLLGAEAASVAVADTAAAAVAALDGPAGATHLVVDAASLVGDGVDLVAALRDVAGAARAAGAHCTVLLSPEAAGISVGDAMMAGASQLVVKPIGAADLMAALRSLYSDDPEPLVAPALLGLRAA